jgi:hypothetical protein
MVTKQVTVVTGKVARDIHGHWEDCSPGWYVGDDKIETIFSQFYRKNIKVTIEEVEEEEENEDA